tara:strand:+ start:807 stop:1532 length:726 start_codon:yes stop_codon:yes gene_type:complete
MFKILHKYANPYKFLEIARPAQRIFGFLSIFFLFIGLYFALFLSPPDYQQSETVRIMYIHVPSAWISLFAYSLIFFMSAFYLIWRFPLFLIVAKEVTTIGLIFTFISLMSGSLWGRPTWGTYWVWDARLTSFLILLFIYLGLALIKKTFSNTGKADNSFAYLALMGGLNLPIIKFSVDWWNTLHQPASVFRVSGPSISLDILIPLLIMSVGFLFLFAFLLLLNIHSNIQEKKLMIESRKHN